MIVAKREAILFLFGCSEVNSTWLITSELANQRARKELFTCVVYTNKFYASFFRSPGAEDLKEADSVTSFSPKEVSYYCLTDFKAIAKTAKSVLSYKILSLAG